MLYCCRKHGNNQDLDDDDDDDDEIGVTESGSTAVTTFVSARGPTLPCHSSLRSVAPLEIFCRGVSCMHVYVHLVLQGAVCRVVVKSTLALSDARQD